MRHIEKIIVHCSDSEWASTEDIRQWHLERGWSDIGYHYVIENCYPSYSSYKKCLPKPKNDGTIVEGRELERVGSHAKGENRNSIGICLVGDNSFTGAQLCSLCELLHELCEDFDLSVNDIYGHRNFSPKDCPNIDTDWLRQLYNEHEL